MAVAGLMPPGSLPERWRVLLNSVLNGKLPGTTITAWGADNTATSDSTVAIQNAIDWASTQVSGTQSTPYPVYYPPGAYKHGTIKFREGVQLIGVPRAGPGYREGAVRVFPYGVPDDGYLYDQDSGNVRSFGMHGINAYGGGATSKTGGVHLTDASDASFSSMHFDNFGIEAFHGDGGSVANCRVSDSYFQGLNNTGHITTTRGAFTLQGADHQVRNCEMTGPGFASVTSSNLYCAAGYIGCDSALIDGVVFQTGDIGCYVNESGSTRFANCRFDTNAGHGLWLDPCTYLTFTGCHFARNSYAQNNNYHHIRIPSTGGSAVFVAPMFTQGTGGVGLVNSCIFDERNTQEFSSTYLHPRGQAGQSLFFRITGLSKVTIADHPFFPLPTGATPIIENLINLTTANTVATNLTNFTRGCRGQPLTLIGNDGGLTTIVNGTTIKTKSGANVPLADGAVITFRLYGTTWIET